MRFEPLAQHLLTVIEHNILGRAFTDNPTSIQKDCAIAEPLYRIKVVRDKYNSRPLRPEI